MGCPNPSGITFPDITCGCAIIENAKTETPFHSDHSIRTEITLLCAQKTKERDENANLSEPAAVENIARSRSFVFVPISE